MGLGFRVLGLRPGLLELGFRGLLKGLFDRKLVEVGRFDFLLGITVGVQKPPAVTRNHPPLSPKL